MRPWIALSTVSWLADMPSISSMAKLCGNCARPSCCASREISASATIWPLEMRNPERPSMRAMTAQQSAAAMLNPVMAPSR